MLNSFHAHGARDLLEQKEFLTQRRAERAQRTAELLAKRAGEIAAAGTFKRLFLLQAIHRQVRQETSIVYRLF